MAGAFLSAQSVMGRRSSKLLMVLAGALAQKVSCATEAAQQSGPKLALNTYDATACTSCGWMSLLPALAEALCGIETSCCQCQENSAKIAKIADITTPKPTEARKIADSTTPKPTEARKIADITTPKPTEADGVFLEDAETKMCVNIKEAPVANERELVWRRSCTGPLLARFQKVAVDKSHFYLKHADSGKCVHPLGGWPGNDKPLVLYEGCGEVRLQFKKVDAGGGKFYLQSVYNNQFCVHPLGGTAGEDVALVFFTGCSGSRLQFEENSVKIAEIATPKPTEAGRFFLQNADTKMCVQIKEAPVANNIALVYRKSCTGPLLAQFQQVGDNRRFYLKHVDSGTCVHPLGGWPGNDKPLVLYDNCDHVRLLFEKVDAGGGKFYLQSAYNSQFCVHPLGGTAGEDVALVFYTGCSGSRLQFEQTFI